MSAVEELHVLKRILGRLPKTEFSSHDRPLDRLMDFIAPPDHVFYPEVKVTDEGVALDVNGFVISIRADPNYAPVKFNLDRPVDNEYSVVWPGVIKIINRLTNKVYLKAPQGQVSVVRIEALRLGV